MFFRYLIAFATVVAVALGSTEVRVCGGKRMKWIEIPY